MVDATNKTFRISHFHIDVDMISRQNTIIYIVFFYFCRQLVWHI